jgi:hypothetical protein
MGQGPLDPERGHAVAAGLRDLGVRGILVTAAEQGYIVELACAVPDCMCPPELGGPKHFVKVPSETPDWMPTIDHFPVPQEKGGERTIDNVRLAHRLCNRVDAARRLERTYEKDLARVEASRTAALRGSATVADVPAFQVVVTFRHQGLHESFDEVADQFAPGAIARRDETAWNFYLLPTQASDVTEAVAVAMNTLYRGLHRLFGRSEVELVELRASPEVD